MNSFAIRSPSASHEFLEEFFRSKIMEKQNNEHKSYTNKPSKS